jgi:hypothetical protein
MSEDKKEFKVNDRRHFTAEGEVRDAADERAPAQAPAPAAAPDPRPPAPPAPPVPEADPSAGGPEMDGEADPGGLPADLIGLFVSLAAQASYLLSDAPAEEGGPPGPDLAGARAVITLLEVLKVKTEGNRTPEEDGVLQRILYELRMAYVARSRKGA